MKLVMRFSAIFIFLSFLVGQSFWGNEFPEPRIEYSPRTYVCYKADSPVVIDGKLDDIAWKRSEWTESFVDIEGDLKPKPFYDTKAKMLWDDNYFYFGVEMEEPHIWATLKEETRSFIMIMTLKYS